MSEDTYKQLRAEWEVKLRQTEINLSSLEKEAEVSLNDLDVALALMTKLPGLYERLDQGQKVSLLQILTKRIIVDRDGEIVDQELNSPFMYLHSIIEGIYSNSQSSEQISVGAPLLLKTTIVTLL